MSKRTSKAIITAESRALKSLRESKGLSMRAAGSELGISDSYISQIENGRENIPTGDKLKKFLDLYGADKRSFNKLVKDWKDNKTDLEWIEVYLPKLKSEQLKMLRALIEQIITKN